MTWTKSLLLACLLLAAPAVWADSPRVSDSSDAGASQTDEHAEDLQSETAEKAEKAEQAEKAEKAEAGEHDSRFPDEAIPLQVDAVPQRPKPPLELGDHFLGTGTLEPGFTLPTGAVWQPRLLAFGTFRTAVQSFESDASPDSRITEWTNRLDLFFNLQLSGTERLVVGFRSLDSGGRFTSYFFEHPDPSREGEFEDELDSDVELLFFEGDFGEIFPNLDRDDTGHLDVGFSVGRQPLFFQEGMLINDTVDGVGFTRDTLQPAKAANLRMTFFYGWDNLNVDASRQRGANLFALLTSTDFRRSTVDLDVAYVEGHENDGFGDLVAAGASFVQRFGKTNTSFRVLGSLATGEETEVSTDGVLLFSELSWTPAYSDDLVYVTTFWAIDQFSPALRGSGPTAGGPLGRAGINFASVGLGSYGAPLSAQARDVAGGAVGYQKFFAGDRRQLLLELGGRVGLRADVEDAVAATARFQTAFGRHTVVVVDGFTGYRELGHRTPYGGRLELLLKF